MSEGQKAFEPVQRGGGIAQRRAGRFMWPVDHDDGNAKRAGGGDLGVGLGAARVLGHHDFDAFALHQVRFGFEAERRTLSDEGDARRKRDVSGRVDGAGDVVMLRGACECAELQATDGQQYAAGLDAECRRGFGGIGDGFPVVAVDRLPRLADNRAKRQAKRACGCNRIGRNVNRVGMRGIDDGFCSLMIEPAYEPVYTAEATDAGGDRLLSGRARAAGEREHGFKACVRGEEPAQLSRFARAA